MQNILRTYIPAGGVSRISRNAIEAEKHETRQGEKAGPARPDPEDSSHDDKDQGIVKKDQEVAPEQAIHVDGERQTHLLDDALRIDEHVAAVGDDAGDQRPARIIHGVSDLEAADVA